MAKRFQKVYVEISNVCNLQCDFCPEVVRAKEFMAPELFNPIISQLAPLTESVCFHLMGEPLAHPKFAEYVQTCAAVGLPVEITSNGVLLNDQRREALLHPIIRQVNFSVHSFEANFPGKDITPYLEKILDFTREAFEKRPDLYINYRLWNFGSTAHNSPTTERLLQKVKECFGADFSHSPDIRWKKGVRVKNRLYLNFDSRFRWPNPADPQRSENGYCHGLGTHIGILADGTVVPCCLDKEGNISLGSCRTTTLEAIIEGERARAMAEGFKRGKLVEDLCRKCTFVSRFDGRVAKLQAGAN
jgi:sulfatase maturation enzyme AslB (radical SAM superfamily)